MIRKTVFSLFLLCFFHAAFAQDYKTLTARIDSFAKAYLPKSALAEVDKLDARAHAEKNAAMQVRAALYRMTFQSVIEDNAIVGIINRLKQDIQQAEYPAKPVLQSLLADMYWQYYRQNRWQFSQRTRQEMPDADFTKWDLQTINTEISRNFDLSLRDWQREQSTPIEQMEYVLVGNASNRYLRPTLYDLLVQQAFDFFLSDEAGIYKPKDPFVLTDPQLFDDSQTFAGLKIATKDTSAIAYKGLLYLQQATLFHLKGDGEEALADIDLKRLSFLQLRALIAGKDSLYLKGLRNIEKQYSQKAISADAWALEGKYFYDKSDFKSAYTYFTKAVQLFPESTGGQNSSLKIKEIEQKSLTVTVENVNMPNKPQLASLNYRNVKTARVLVYKLTIGQYTQLAKIPSDVNRYSDGVTISASDSAFRYLAKLKPIMDKKFELPGTEDYNRHFTEFKIDPLPSGHYVLTVRDDQSDDKGTVELTGFKICKLAYLARRKSDAQVEVQVMNRETGEPVSGVHVTLAETENGTSDKGGKCFFNWSGNFNAYSIKLTSATDTLYTTSNYLYSVPQKPHINTVLFTDRGMYRPGQTIYFKGLQVYTEDGKSTIVTNTRLNVTIRDNNQKQLIAIPVTTNDFGTFSGTYTLPQSILNGGISINTEHGSKYVSVEEYKRPSFQVSILPVTENYKPGDSVAIKGKVTAYSGYGISQARVAYHITRNIYSIPYWFYQNTLPSSLGNTEFATDTIKTDDQGRFEIKFKATTQAEAELKKMTYQYNINVDVTDGSGETRSASTWLKLGANDISIVASIPAQVSARDSIRLLGYLNNLNNSMIKGTMQLKVYALQSPGRLFKARLWNKPDQYIMNREQYKTDFPDYVYKNEDDENRWPVKNKVTELNMIIDKRQSFFNLDILKKQPTGSYKIVINAKNERGDTSSAVRYVYLLNEPGKPDKMNDWVIPVSTSAEPGKPAGFLLGTGKQAHVLMEKYIDTKMISSEWLDIPAGKQRLVKVPVNVGQKGIYVQFLMGYHNRSYTTPEYVTNTKEADGLDIKLMTFKDVLQPGEKEQWKLRVSGKNNEKVAAEMVADLYDASLDGLGRSDYWNINVNNVRYPEVNWNYPFVNQAMTNPLRYTNQYYGWSSRVYEHLNLFGYNYYGGYNYAYRSYLTKSKTQAFYDTVEYRAMDYSVMEKKELTGAVASLNEVRIGGSTNITLRGSSTVSARLNGKDYAGGTFASATANLPADIIEHIQLIDDYGDQASLSGNEPNKILNITTRKNFAETAFFYPQLHTDEKGEILIDFTIPESLAKWKFKAFTHTRDLKTAYIEKEIVTQKKLSITANMPRFLREGDTIIVSARLANLVNTALKGKIALQLFNGINMQPVHLLVDAADAQQSFDIASATTKTAKFKLVVPAGLDALTYKLTAEAGEFADGEENTIPVLPNRILVTESMPMMVRAGQEHNYTFDKLINQHSATLKNKTLTLEYTQNSAWYAVQALPYVMEFPYECSEQLFSRYYANSLGVNIIGKMPVIKQVFDQWKMANSAELLSNLEKNQELKATLIEETPWLRDAQNESEQKKRIALLFDVNKMGYELQQNLDKLQQRQLGDGGFPWFGGDRADRYITVHILEGIGQLYHLNITDTKNVQLKNIADKAMQYLNAELIADANWEKKNNTYESRLLGPMEVYSYYTKSYFPDEVMTTEMKELQANYLRLAETQWKLMNVYQQGLITLTMLRDSKPEVARGIIKSLLETAQQNDDMGMYWAKNRLVGFGTNHRLKRKA